MEDLIIGVIIIIGTVGLILIFRFVVLWYWKINKVVSLLESIDNNLKNINNISK